MVAGLMRSPHSFTYQTSDREHLIALVEAVEFQQSQEATLARRFEGLLADLPSSEGRDLEAIELRFAVEYHRHRAGLLALVADDLRGRASVSGLLEVAG